MAQAGTSTHTPSEVRTCQTSKANGSAQSGALEGAGKTLPLPRAEAAPRRCRHLDSSRPLLGRRARGPCPPPGAGGLCSLAPVPWRTAARKVQTQGACCVSFKSLHRGHCAVWWAWPGGEPGGGSPGGAYSLITVPHPCLLRESWRPWNQHPEADRRC